MSDPHCLNALGAGVGGSNRPAPATLNKSFTRNAPSDHH
jgi:hypothetical protein